MGNFVNTKLVLNELAHVAVVLKVLLCKVAVVVSAERCILWVCLACAVFGSASSSAGEEDQPAPHPRHIVECLNPLRVMLKALTTSHYIKAVIREDQFFTFCYQINPRTYAKVNAKVSTVLKELPY